MANSKVGSLISRFNGNIDEEKSLPPKSRPASKVSTFKPAPVLATGSKSAMLERPAKSNLKVTSIVSRFNGNIDEEKSLPPKSRPVSKVSTFKPAPVLATGSKPAMAERTANSNSKVSSLLARFAVKTVQEDINRPPMSRPTKRISTFQPSPLTTISNIPAKSERTANSNSKVGSLLARFAVETVQEDISGPPMSRPTKRISTFQPSPLTTISNIPAKSGHNNSKGEFPKLRVPRQRGKEPNNVEKAAAIWAEIRALSKSLHRRQPSDAEKTEMARLGEVAKTNGRYISDRSLESLVMIGD